MISERDIRISQLSMEVTQQKQAVEDALVRLAFSQDGIKRWKKDRAKETSGYMAEITKVTDKLSIVTSENKALRGSRAEKDVVISGLMRVQRQQERTIMLLRAEIARLGRKKN